MFKDAWSTFIMNNDDVTPSKRQDGELNPRHFDLSLGAPDEVRFVSIRTGEDSYKRQAMFNSTIAQAITESHDASYEEKTTESVYLTEEAIMKLLPPELQGRISRTIILKPFTEQDYRRIMFSRRYSPVRHISEKQGITLKVSADRAEEIAHNAFINRMGVRSMNNAISRFVDSIK